MKSFVTGLHYKQTPELRKSIHKPGTDGRNHRLVLIPRKKVREANTVSTFGHEHPFAVYNPHYM
uniref:Uncharacterized protein n=1 Tax=Octopus bimaculoides TaxID=37653 RepID=A0A0L8H1J6_OCTBM